MNTSTDDWRNKYLDSLRTMESEEQRFKGMESILKRLVGRLCIACLGLSPRLDQELKKLQAAARREVTTDELEAIMPALTEAVVALDEKTSTASSVPAAVVTAVSAAIAELPNESSIRSSLSALLAELKRDSSLSNQIVAIDEKLGQPLTAEQLASILSSLTEIVSKRIQRIERERQEAQALLAQMVSRLDEINHFVADQRQNNTQVLASSESLNAQLTGEFKAISVSVESGSDLHQIREQVRTRLDSIGSHLQEFHKRETERASTMHQRAEQMQARVAELEADLRGREADRVRHELVPRHAAVVRPRVAVPLEVLLREAIRLQGW